MSPEDIWVQGDTWHENKNALAVGGEPVRYIRADLFDEMTATCDRAIAELNLHIERLSGLEQENARLREEISDVRAQLKQTDEVLSIMKDLGNLSRLTDEVSKKYDIKT